MKYCEMIMQAVENLGIGYAIFQDTDKIEGAVLDINNALAKIVGYQREELIGKKSFTEFLTENSLKLVYERYRKRLRGEDVPSHYTIEIKTRYGKIRILDAYIQLVEYNGKPATLGIYIDNTEREELRKSTEATLRMQRKLIAAINYAPDAIIITDIDGTIRYVNPAFTKITGYFPSEVIGKNPRILKSGKHDKTFYKKLWNTLKAGKIWEGNFINKRKNGELYTENAVIAPVFDEKGKIAAYISIKRDITLQKKLEEQVIQSQKMDAIGLLASGVAHDFNNILGGIIGYIELLRIKYANDEYLLSVLDSMEKAGERATTLIDKLLTFSKSKDVKKEPLNINEHIRNVIDIISRSMPKNIKINLSLSPDIPIINANPTQIEQVIMNICINAFQAIGDKGGEVDIATERFFPDDEFLSYHYGFKKAEYILISISDTGPGMSDEVKKKIFEPFFTTKENGTGLGLSTVYNIVESHGGKIILYTMEGEGTTFNIYLPVLKEGMEIELGERKIVKKGRGKILVIDDEEIVREMMKDVLEELGYTPLFAKKWKRGCRIV